MIVQYLCNAPLQLDKALEAGLKSKVLYNYNLYFAETVKLST